jgi:predicted RNA-binding protein with PIN domain
VLPPTALRRYLNFARLTSRSLEAIARVVERDDEFRARVAGAVDEAQVGRAGWLWLTRPDGWEAELAELEATAAARAADEREEREERAATRKLAAAQSAAARAEAEAVARIAELSELRAELASERAGRAAAEARLAEVEASRVELATARSEVVRKLKAVESRLVDRATEVNAVKARLRALEAEARELRAPSPASASDVPAGGAPGAVPGDAPGDAGPAGVEADGAAPGAGGPTVSAAQPPLAGASGSGPSSVGASGAAAPTAGASGVGPSGAGAAGAPVEIDPAVVADEVARAAGGAAALADALAGLARVLVDGRTPAPAAPTAPPADGRADTPRPANGRAGETTADGRAEEATAEGRAETPPPADGRADTPPPAAGAAGMARRAVDCRDVVGRGDDLAAADGALARVRRVPQALPGGMFDDTVEAAEHLLRAPGAVLVVDGYNVTMTGWPELGAADQRRRLVTALSDLAARTASHVELVFDGADIDPVPVPAPARQLVRVRFSDPGVEADDVVIELAGCIPAATPVIVASSDNRVREGARRAGANLLHARQLLDVMGR